ncbi:hypothetical protein XENTR_v10009331 [Xenopus tropicalis]|nr:hypothetical protein XENTR_v10009331 [Xenopus tropicalis]
MFNSSYKRHKSNARWVNPCKLGTKTIKQTFQVKQTSCLLEVIEILTNEYGHKGLNAVWNLLEDCVCTQVQK